MKKGAADIWQLVAILILFVELWSEFDRWRGALRCSLCADMRWNESDRLRGRLQSKLPLQSKLGIFWHYIHLKIVCLRCAISLLLCCCCLLIHNVPPCHHSCKWRVRCKFVSSKRCLCLAITRWLTIECTTNLNLVDDASVAPKNVVRLNFVSRFVLKKKIIFDTLWMPRCVLLLVLCCFRLLWFWNFWHFVLLRVALLGWEVATFPTVRFSHFSVFIPFWRTVSLDRISDDQMTCWFAFCMVIAVLLIIFIISMVWTVSHSAHSITLFAFDV